MLSPPWRICQCEFVLLGVNEMCEHDDHAEWCNLPFSFYCTLSPLALSFVPTFWCMDEENAVSAKGIGSNIHTHTHTRTQSKERGRRGMEGEEGRERRSLEKSYSSYIASLFAPFPHPTHHFSLHSCRSTTSFVTGKQPTKKMSRYYASFPATIC